MPDANVRSAVLWPGLFADPHCVTDGRGVGEGADNAQGGYTVTRGRVLLAGVLGGSNGRRGGFKNCRQHCSFGYNRWVLRLT